MGEANRIENLDQEEYRSLGKILQAPVRDTVRARNLADLEIPDGFLNLVRVRSVGFTGRDQGVRPQRHVNHLNNCRDRRIGHRLKVSLLIVANIQI